MSGDQDILGAFRSAVDETMQDMEAEMKTRVRVGRQDYKKAAKAMSEGEMAKAFYELDRLGWVKEVDDERTAYVAVTRGREKVEIFTDDKEELLSAMTRQDDPMSATELTRNHRSKKRGLGRGQNTRADTQTAAKEKSDKRELDNER